MELWFTSEMKYMNNLLLFNIYNIALVAKKTKIFYFYINGLLAV